MFDSKTVFRIAIKLQQLLLLVMSSCCPPNAIHRFSYNITFLSPISKFLGFQRFEFSLFCQNYTGLSLLVQRIFALILQLAATFYSVYYYMSCHFYYHPTHNSCILKQRSSHKGLWHWYSPMNFAKFLRPPFLQNTSGRLLLNKFSLILYQILLSLQIDFFDKYLMYRIWCMEDKKQNHIACYILKMKMS